MSEIYVNRAGLKYGPYTIDKAEAFYREGRFLPDDFVWKTGMDAWQPAADMFGHLAPALDVAAGALPEGAAMPVAHYGAAGPSSVDCSTESSDVPLPPKLHWACVLLFSIITLGIFFIVWMFVQSRWVKKIDPTSNASLYLTTYLLLTLAGQAMSEASGNGLRAVGLLAILGAYVVFYIAMYSMRRSMLNRFAGDTALGLTLSPALVFLFSVLYFQSRMTRIHRVITGG